jgi:hypothetical protein
LIAQFHRVSWAQGKEGRVVDSKLMPSIDHSIETLYWRISQFVVEHVILFWICLGVFGFLWVFGVFRKLKNNLYAVIDRLKSFDIEPQRVQELNSRVRALREKQQREFEVDAKKIQQKQREKETLRKIEMARNILYEN